MGSGPSPWNRYTLSGLVAILLWSTTVALGRSLSEQLGPLTAAAAVYLVGGGLCLARLVGTGSLRRQLRAQPGRYLFGCGSLFVLYVLTLFLALGLAADRRQVLEVGLVNYCWPALTIWLSLVLLGKRARLLLLPATVLALAGVFLVLTQEGTVTWRTLVTNVGNNPAAYALAAVAAISWGFYSNLTRRWAAPEGEGAVTVFMPVTGLALLMLRLGHQEPGGWSLGAVAEIAFLGGSVTLAYVLWELAMRRGDVVLVAACSYLTPLVSTLVACLYLGVLAGPRLWLGCCALVVGSLLSWAAVTDRGPPEPKAPRLARV